MEKNSITSYNPAINRLSVSKQTAIQRWKEQPMQSYQEMRVTTPQKMIIADTPNLWEIRLATNHATAVGIVVKALIHTARLVNLEKNLTESQIGEIANDVIDEFGYIKVEELKYILKRAVRNEKIFARLDYNVIMNWFEEYDKERTDIAIDISNQQESEQANSKATTTSEEISFNEYHALLKQRVADGDERAKQILEDIESRQDKGLTLLTSDEKREKEIAFKQWFYGDYLKNKKP